MRYAAHTACKGVTPRTKLCAPVYRADPDHTSDVLAAGTALCYVSQHTTVTARRVGSTSLLGSYAPSLPLLVPR